MVLARRVTSARSTSTAQSEELLEREAGGEDVGREVDGPQQLLGHVGAAHLLVRITGSQGILQPCGAFLICGASPRSSPKSPLLPAQLRQLGLLVAGGAFTLALVDHELAYPAVQRALGDPDFLRDLAIGQLNP